MRLPLQPSRAWGRERGSRRTSDGAPNVGTWLASEGVTWMRGAVLVGTRDGISEPGPGGTGVSTGVAGGVANGVAGWLVLFVVPSGPYANAVRSTR